jgi:hypothetical protein
MEHSPEQELALVARFETDERGEPRYVESKGRKHYEVVFEVENAPAEAYAATFKLDPQTYYDPVRTLRKENDGKFRLKTTTYGDYGLKVELRTSDGKMIPLRAHVKDLLKASPNVSTSASWKAALDYISAH